MRVLLFVDDFKGGAGNVIQLLALDLKQRGHCVSVACLGGKTPGRYDMSNIPVHRIGSKSNRILTYLGYESSSRKLITEYKPDCVVSFLFGVSSFVNLALVGKKTPLVVSERSDPNYLKPEGIIKVLTEYAYKRADAIVVLFDSFKNLSEGKYLNKAVTIPNPVPALNMSPKIVDPDAIKFVTIANNTPPKGLDILVDAFVEAHELTKNIELRIYGSDKSGDLKRVVESKDANSFIKLMGYTLDVNAALEWADVYVMPSRHEGFPNSLCEAMSAGKCCIATECHSGIVEIIQNGNNGILVPSENSHELAMSIVNLSKDPTTIQRIGAEAIKVSQKYNPVFVFDEWEHLIERVIQ